LFPCLANEQERLTVIQGLKDIEALDGILEEDENEFRLVRIIKKIE
jgi:hypothetical protein